jgi:hypothetical protein
MKANWQALPLFVVRSHPNSKAQQDQGREIKSKMAGISLKGRQIWVRCGTVQRYHA